MWLSELSGLSDLKKKIENMSEEEKEIEKRNKIIDIVERILEFNDWKQRGQGLKILTPNQMLTRLPITLAQLKAGNSPEKLKNEIRQLLYSLYSTIVPFKRNWPKQSLTIWSTLFKNGNNLYEHQK